MKTLLKKMFKADSYTRMIIKLSACVIIAINFIFYPSEVSNLMIIFVGVYFGMDALETLIDILIKRDNEKAKKNTE
jgi:chromate transport protein ChrA